MVGCRVALATALLAASSGCAESPSLRAARSGDVVALRSLLSNGVDADAARALAHATASGLVARAEGREGARTIGELSACAPQLASELTSRSRRVDEPAASAARLLLDAGVIEARRVVVPKGTESSAEWGPVRARILVGAEDGDRRRTAMLDVDEAVRAEALRASIASADSGDVDALLDAARRDPNAMNRRLALEALGALGGERAVLAMRDVWASGSTGDRAAVLDAWASKRALDAGGARELEWALGSPSRAMAIRAASKLANAGNAAAVALLRESMVAGSVGDRALAIELAPLEIPSLAESAEMAFRDSDAHLRRAAAARLLERRGRSTERASLVAELLAAPNAEPEAACTSRAVLARAQAPEVVPVLVRDLAVVDRSARESAAILLATAGQSGLAAALLVDVDPRVRVRVACAILRGAPPVDR